MESRDKMNGKSKQCQHAESEESESQSVSLPYVEEPCWKSVARAQQKDILTKKKNKQ